MAAVIVAGAAYWLWSHPQVRIDNALVTPVSVHFSAGEPPVVVASGAVWTGRLARTDSLRVAWRTTTDSADNATGGATDSAVVPEISGDVSEAFGRNLFGTTHIVITAGLPDAAYFAPLVTNATSVPLSITVNVGLHNDAGESLATACNCVVPPGATRRFVGYFKLFGNSSVEAATSDGRTARFENIGLQANRRSGRVNLKFRDGDLQRSP